MKLILLERFGFLKIFSFFFVPCPWFMDWILSDSYTQRYYDQIQCRSSFFFVDYINVFEMIHFFFIFFLQNITKKNICLEICIFSAKFSFFFLSSTKLRFEKKWFSNLFKTEVFELVILHTTITMILMPQFTLSCKQKPTFPLDSYLLEFHFYIMCTSDKLVA